MERRLNDITDIRLTGELGNRIAQAVRNAVEIPHPRAREHYAKKPTEYEWGGDFHGRWVEVAALWSQFYPAPKALVDNSLRLLSDALSRDGSIRRKGNANDDFHVMCSNWKALCGFLAAYEMIGGETLLTAARKMGLRYWNKYLDSSRYPKVPLFSTQLPAALECLVKLYKITNDARYVEICEALADFVIRTSRRVADGATVHTHTWLSSVRGVVDLYGITKDKTLLQAVDSIWQYVHDDVVWLSGGIPEVTYKSDDCTDESCSISDWIRLNLSLWQASGDAKYLEDAERALLNHTYFTQLPNGGMSAACNIEQGFRGSEGWMCCSFNGPLMFHQLSRTIFAAGDGIAWINFLLPGEARLDLGDGRMFTIEQTGGYPEEGKVAIRINPDEETTATIAIRVPAWVFAKDISLSINGKETAKPEPDGGYLMLKRQWKRGDSIEMSFPMPMRVETSVVGSHKPLGKVRIDGGKPSPAKLIGVFRGPLLLAVFRTDHNLDITWANRNGFNEALDSGGYYGGWNGSICDIATYRGETSSTGEPVKLSRIDVTESHVLLSWQSWLGGVAEIDNKLTVHNRLPVEMLHEEHIKIRPGVKPDQLLACGTRIARKKHQWQEKYRDLSSYEYPEPVLEIKGDRSYVLKNDGFEVRCSCSGDVEALERVNEEDWLGAYVRPNLKLSPESTDEYRISKRMIFTRPTYAAASWADADSASGDKMLAWGRKKEQNG